VSINDEPQYPSRKYAWYVVVVLFLAYTSSSGFYAPDPQADAAESADGAAADERGDEA
jgi:hypothetical protein